MTTSFSLPLIDGPDWAGIHIHTTTRAGGVSVPPYDSLNLGSHVGDDPAAVAMNRARLGARLPQAACWLSQVHGTTLVDADALPEGPGDVPPVADAAITTRRGRPLAILTADCLPVVIVDAQARALAVAHAGWRGLAAGVLEAAVAGLHARGAGTGLRAWLGPCIGPTAFEVGADVHAAFAGEAQAFTPRPEVPGKWWCDLPALAASRLARAGVHEVVSSGLCTVTDARFYSYRRDGTTGRLATLAWLATVA